MKILVFFSLSLSVALAAPPLPPGVAVNPALTRGEQSPLLGDWVPVQGHVVVEDPASQAKLGSEGQEKSPPVASDVVQSQSQSELEQEGEVKTEVKLEPELKAEPEVKVEQEAEVWTEVKMEPELKAEPEVKVEQEGEVKTEVKMEPELKAEPEVKVEQEGEVKTEVKMEPELKAEPEVKVEQEGEVKTEVKMEPELKAEPEVKVEQEGEVKTEVKMEPELKAEPEVKVEQEGEVKTEVKMEPELKAEPEVKVEQRVMVDPEPELKLNPDVVELEVNIKPEDEMELKTDPDFKVEPDIPMELEPEENMFNDVQQEYQVQLSLEEENEKGPEIEERHIDMERNYKMMIEPIMELEPLSNENRVERSEKELFEMEKSLRAAFQNQDPVLELLPEEEKGLMRKRDYVLVEEPIMELEPEMGKEPFQNQEVLSDPAFMEGGQMMDTMGQQMLPMEKYFPNNEVRMGMEQQASLIEEGSDYIMMEGARSEIVREE